MKIALAQMASVTGDIDGNVKKIIEIIAQAKGKADLVVFPEMAITGYCISDLIEDDAFVQANKKALEEIAKVAKDITVAVGFVDYDVHGKNNDGRVRKYNAAALLQHGGVRGIAHKTLLPAYRYFDDKRYFTPATQRAVLTMDLAGKVLPLGISICEDMWDDDYDIKVVDELARAGAAIIVNLNASPYHFGKYDQRAAKIKAHVAKHKIPFVYVNTVGAADNGKNIITFDGDSLAFNKEGGLIARGKKFAEDLLIVDTEAGEIKPRQEDIKLKDNFEALVMALKDYAQQTGFSKAILPLSGGIDSALGLVLAAEALGPENVQAYNLPSKYNSATTRGIAQKLAGNLGVAYGIIPIGEIDAQVKSVFEAHAHEITDKVAKENLHARIRGLLMMLASNETGRLLISNGNKTEIALGYATLYGDMCGGISVIGDLNKTEVFAMARYVNERYGREIMPQELFTIAPSAELSEDQVDPFDYEIVAPLVDMMITLRDAPLALIDKYDKQELGGEIPMCVYDLDREAFVNLVKRLHQLIQRSVYKRLQGPPIIAITQRAFGFDLRETIINKWDGGNDEN